jgi:hypothetical protein
LPEQLPAEGALPKAGRAEKVPPKQTYTVWVDEVPPVLSMAVNMLPKRILPAGAVSV